MTDKKQNSNGSPGKIPLLRNPAVVAALVTAVVAGLFGLLTTVINPDFLARWWDLLRKRDTVENVTRLPESNQDTGTQQVTTNFDFGPGPLSARLNEIRRALVHRVNNEPDIVTRRSAITALVTISSENPPEFYFAEAVEMLVEYVRDNIDERRGPGEQVEVDKRPPQKYRPRDIIDAMEALQEIRRASADRVEVKLGSVDFHQINLSGLDLEGFYFGHADFSYSSLSNCRCRGADFRHARFFGTNIWGTLASAPADFREANFLKAELTHSRWANVDFAGSNIEKAVGHRQARVWDEHGMTPAQRKLFPD
jgi:hypothetical protein